MTIDDGDDDDDDLDDWWWWWEHLQPGGAGKQSPMGGANKTWSLFCFPELNPDCHHHDDDQEEEEEDQDDDGEHEDCGDDHDVNYDEEDAD